LARQRRGNFKQYFDSGAQHFVAWRNLTPAGAVKNAVGVNARNVVFDRRATSIAQGRDALATFNTPNP
jgi:hypothetical protein